MTNASEGLFEFFVQWDLKSIRQTIVHVRHTNNAHQFSKHGVCHSLGDGCSSVRGDAIIAPVRHAHGDINQFADERVQFTRTSHDGFQCRPCSLQCRRMIGEGFPEIIDLVCLAGRPDVIKYLSYQPTALFVFDQCLNETPPSTGNCEMMDSL